jgi:hypothetical protein
MQKTKSRRSSFIRVRLSIEERRIIDGINSHDYTNVSEHVRRTLNYYARNVYPNVMEEIRKEAYEE